MPIRKYLGIPPQNTIYSTIGWTGGTSAPLPLFIPLLRWWWWGGREQGREGGGREQRREGGGREQGREGEGGERGRGGDGTAKEREGGWYLHKSISHYG